MLTYHQGHQDHVSMNFHSKILLLPIIQMHLKIAFLPSLLWKASHFTLITGNCVAVMMPCRHQGPTGQNSAAAPCSIPGTVTVLVSWLPHGLEHSMDMLTFRKTTTKYVSMSRVCAKETWISNYRWYISASTEPVSEACLTHSVPFSTHRVM